MLGMSLSNILGQSQRSKLGLTINQKNKTFKEFKHLKLLLEI